MARRRACLGLALAISAACVGPSRAGCVTATPQQLGYCAPLAGGGAGVSVADNFGTVAASALADAAAFLASVPGAAMPACAAAAALFFCQKGSVDTTMATTCAGGGRRRRARGVRGGQTVSACDAGNAACQRRRASSASRCSTRAAWRR